MGALANSWVLERALSGFVVYMRREAEDEGWSNGRVQDKG